jgi:hypothetical protein
VFVPVCIFVSIIILAAKAVAYLNEGPYQGSTSPAQKDKTWEKVIDTAKL